MVGALGPCGDIARRFDRDRYVCGLFAGTAARPAVMALLAVAVELGRTRERVSEAMLGEIRLQWWRDAIDEIFAGRPRRHEVVRGLAEAVATFELPRQPLDDMIEARVADLADDPPARLVDLQHYARATSGALHQLILQAQGVSDDTALSVADHVGTAWSLVGLVRASGYLARVGRVVVPQEVLAAAGARSRDLREARTTPAVIDALRRVADHAESLLPPPGSMQAGPMQAACAPAVLPAVILRRYLAELRRPDWRPYAMPVSAVRGLMPLRLWWAAARGRY